MALVVYIKNFQMICIWVSIQLHGAESFLNIKSRLVDQDIPPPLPQWNPKAYYREP
jgi:hypothetical protein